MKEVKEIWRANKRYEGESQIRGVSKCSERRGKGRYERKAETKLGKEGKTERYKRERRKEL